jgi:uncharacterized membrane protein
MSTSTDSHTDVTARVQQAKAPVSAVAGPYGHPFHPILVTIPIGAWVCSLVFDIATKVNSAGSKSFVDASYWLIGIGIVGALLAAVFGLMDLTRIPRRTRAMRFGLAHMLLNLTVVGLFVGDFLWRHNSYYEDAKVMTGPLVLSAVALGLLLVSGWIGGMLAYRFGVRVAAESDQVAGYASTYPS